MPADRGGSPPDERAPGQPGQPGRSPESAGAGAAGPGESGHAQPGRGPESAGVGAAGAGESEPGTGSGADIDDAESATRVGIRGSVELARSEHASPSVVTWVQRLGRPLPDRVLRGIWFWVAVYSRFARHRGPVLAGGLAFFGLLSLVPAFLSLASVATLLIEPASIAAAADTILANNPQAAETLQPIFDLAHEAATAGSSSASLTAMVSLGVSLYAASRFIYVGHQVLDIAFETAPKPPTLLKRMAAIAVTLLAQLAFVVGILVLGLVPRVLGVLGIAEAYEAALRILRQPLMVVAVYLLLTASVRYGIRLGRSVPWLNPGAAAGTLIVAIGTGGLSWFLHVSRTYSEIVTVLGGVIALELWLYVIGIGIVVSAETEGVRHRLRREAANGSAGVLDAS